MMLDFLDATVEAARIQHAVRAVLAAGRALTRDLGGSAGTRDCTDAVIKALA
jgi:isocitrate/isopropylmalate dehydrogenase